MTVDIHDAVAAAMRRQPSTKKAPVSRKGAKAKRKQ
jgi:hypothetical protein